MRHQLLVLGLLASACSSPADPARTQTPPHAAEPDPGHEPDGDSTTSAGGALLEVTGLRRVPTPGFSHRSERVRARMLADDPDAEWRVELVTRSPDSSWRAINDHLGAPSPPGVEYGGVAVLPSAGRVEVEVVCHRAERPPLRMREADALLDASYREPSFGGFERAALAAGASACEVVAVVTRHDDDTRSEQRFCWTLGTAIEDARPEACDQTASAQPEQVALWVEAANLRQVRAARATTTTLDSDAEPDVDSLPAYELVLRTEVARTDSSAGAWIQAECQDDRGHAWTGEALVELSAKDLGHAVARRLIIELEGEANEAPTACRLTTRERANLDTSCWTADAASLAEREAFFGDPNAAPEPECQDLGNGLQKCIAGVASTPLEPIFISPAPVPALVAGPDGCGWK